MLKYIKSKGGVGLTNVSPFYKCLNGTQIKIIALIAMTFDHIGFYLMGNYIPFRIIGRLAFPLFAFMISEGAKYTKNKLKYFLRIFILGIICQIFYTALVGTFYLNILITLSLSILIIFSIEFSKKANNKFSFLIPIAVSSAIILIDYFLANVIKPVGYHLDYSVLGVFLPVIIFIFKNYKLKILATSIGLILLSLSMNHIQFWCLLALIPLMLYNQKAGKYRLKWLFYIYYPLHLGIIYIINHIFVS